MSFSEKKFKAWFADLKGKKVTVEDMARWGYAEAEKELMPVLEALTKTTKTNFDAGKLEGYEQRKREAYADVLKTRSSKHFDLKCSKAYNVGFEEGYAHAKRTCKVMECGLE
jgi:hypothetical protein